MLLGSKLENKIYFTKNGFGKVIKFNEGFVIGTKERAPILPFLTNTDNVWCAGGVSRHIKDIEETEEGAMSIRYPNS